MAAARNELVGTSSPMSHKTLTNEGLSELPVRQTFRQWVFRVLMMGLNEGFALEDIAEWIKAAGKEKGYSRYRIYRELKRNGMVSLKQCRTQKLVKCGRCGKGGALTVYYDDTNKTPRYYVRHGRIGTWINNKAAKYRRCYQKPEHYEYLHKQIEVYEQQLKHYEGEPLEYMRTELLRQAAAWKKLKQMDLV